MSTAQIKTMKVLSLDYFRYLLVSSRLVFSLEGYLFLFFQFPFFLFGFFSVGWLEVNISLLEHPETQLMSQFVAKNECRSLYCSFRLIFHLDLVSLLSAAGKARISFSVLLISQAYLNGTLSLIPRPLH